MQKFWSSLLFIMSGLFSLVGFEALFDSKSPLDISSGVFALVLAVCLILWGARQLGKTWALKIPNKTIVATVVITFFIACFFSQDKVDPKQQATPKTNITEQQKPQQTPQSTEGFDKLETSFLRTLQELNISPKVEIRGNIKFYSTDFSTLQIDNYPSTNSATAMMIPVSDIQVENVKSMGLIGAYVKTVVHEDAVATFITTLSKALKNHKEQSFISNGFRVSILPPDKQASIPMIGIEVVKI